MTAATVIIPVHRHAAPLRLSAGSVLRQSIQSIEIFLVGDGVDDATRAVVHELLATDDRIRFFDFPKGPRKGEVHWHKALQEARGRFVAYLGSDDCWLPNHLEVLDDLLKDADFGHTLHVSLSTDRSKLVALGADLQNPAFRKRMVATLFNRFDFSFGGHTLAAYDRLPGNWGTMPPDFPYADLYLWRQFLSQPWCQARSAFVPTGIHTETTERPNLSDMERAKELAYWCEQFSDPNFRERLWRETAQSLATRLVDVDLRLERKRQQFDAVKEQFDAVKDSTSWKLTAPLRHSVSFAKNLLRKIRKRS
jgi:glycosyltransferase involved in cell wall biosynthesis